MENLLLIADSTYASKDENGDLYFRGSFSAKTWERYLKIADKIHFICREDKKIYSKEVAIQQLQKCPSNRIDVSFVLNPKESFSNYFNPAISRYNKKLLKDAISEANGIIIRTLGCVSASFIIRIIRKNRKKYLYECVGNAWDALWYYGIKGKLLAPSAYYTEKKLAANANAVLYVTEKYLQRWYPTKAPQIGISDVDIPVSTTDVLEARIKKINQRTSTLILGTAGSVEVTYKGQEYVIRAIAELNHRGVSNIEYQLAGNGDNSRLRKIAIEEGIDNKIIFLGALSHDAVIKWLDSIDIYIQPSMLEGMPRALIEAMSRGLPCIGSNVGGIPELLDENSMFTKKKVKEIADHIEKMSINFMKEQAERNYLYSKKFYDVQKDNNRINFYKAFEKQCTT